MKKLHPILRNEPFRKALAAVFANGLLLFLWVWLFHPVFPYLRIIFTRQEFRTNQIVLFAVLALIAYQVRRSRFPLTFWNLPQLFLPGLGLTLAGAAAFIAAERWLDINTLSASLFGLASYGLLGLWMEPGRWRRGLPAALLLVGVLPFGEHMDTFIGYPLRLGTANVVSQGLAALGIPNLGVDTILVFENGVSQVDSPCSGVKSLWTGGMFLLAATWIEARPVNRRWLFISIVFGLLLVVSNLARVVLLVLAGPVAGWDLLAEMLHVPLGVIGFAAACGAALALLSTLGSAQAARQAAQPAMPAQPRWLAPALAIAFTGLVLLYSPRPQPAAAAFFEWHLPPGLNARAWPLSETERNWLTSNSSLPISASRWRFQSGELSGSLLFIASDTWRGHHRPERCFTIYGLEVQESRPHLVTPDFPIRWLTLGKAEDPHPLYTAGYWLQSKDRITEDYAQRIWDDLAPQPQSWVLVTVLFDRPTGPEDAQELFTSVHQAVQVSLEGNGP